MTTPSIEDSVRANLENYFEVLGDQAPRAAVYDMVLAAVELPMLELVMRKVGNNQSKAARWLGLNRNTLHKKLRRYRLI